MRHGRKIKKLGRTKSHRKAMLANMAASLLMHHVIKTTEAKAKEVRKLAEKLITLGKRGDLHAHRQVYDVIRDRKLVKKVFDEIAPKFADRQGGYTRVVKLGIRKGDGAALSVVELLLEKPPKEDKKGKKEKPGKKAKAEKTKEPKVKAAKKERVKTDKTQVKAADQDKPEGAEDTPPDKAKTDTKGEKSEEKKPDA
jgi:large subunit ribosomal protein L17